LKLKAIKIDADLCLNSLPSDVCVLMEQLQCSADEFLFVFFQLHLLSTAN